MSILSPIFNFSTSFVCFPFFFLSLDFLASFRLCAITKYSFDMSSMLIIPSSIPGYLGCSDANRVCFTAASHPKRRKNGATPDDSVRKSCMLLLLSKLDHPIQLYFLVVLLWWP